MQATVIIALGSNRRHGRYGSPAQILRAAVVALRGTGLEISQVSRLRTTAPVGPKQRGYVNAAVRGTTCLSPSDLLTMLHGIEREFGRRRRRKWGPRVLDLDLIAYGHLVTRSADLMLPHPEMHRRSFVLDPLCDIHPDWRHPTLGLSARQLRVRLTRPTPIRRETPAHGGS
jgi:2-amino-4-hydroxy-6-hydroxymethyldihydropteridine diphosphokinase